MLLLRDRAACLKLEEVSPGNWNRVALTVVCLVCLLVSPMFRFFLSSWLACTLANRSLMCCSRWRCFRLVSSMAHPVRRSSRWISTLTTSFDFDHVFRLWWPPAEDCGHEAHGAPFLRTPCLLSTCLWVPLSHHRHLLCASARLRQLCFTTNFVLRRR